MRRKSSHKFEHTVGQIEESFEDFVRRLGGRYDEQYAKRLRRMSIDGVPMAARHAERRQPRSNFYDQTYLEARETLLMLVDLDMDEDGTDARRRDKPDIAAHFPSRKPLFVEHRSVSMPGTPFPRHLEEARLAFEDLAAKDSVLHKLLHTGMLSVYVTDPGIEDRCAPDILAAEAAQMCTKIQGEVRSLGADPDRQPMLSRYRASLTYRPEMPMDGLIYREAGGAFDPTPQWVGVELQKALGEKRVAARKYDPRCRPLWLLLSLNNTELHIPEFVRPLVEGALVDADVSPFDGVVVRMTGMKPVIFKAR